MKYLINTVETYRVDTDAEADALINDAKHDRHFTLSKYSREQKEVTKGGEVIDSWFRVTLTKAYQDEKEPVEAIAD